MDPESFVLIHQFAGEIQSADGLPYTAEVWGQQRDDGTWVGWIEFRPVGGGAPARRTGQETSQPNRGALAYWSTGLEPVYIDGAFSRAG